MLHDKVKQTHGIKLTDTAWDSIGEAATTLGISRSELVERLGRKGVEWLVEMETPVKIPIHARRRILQEYGEKLQRVVVLDEGSQVSVFVCPPYVYLDFNKEGRQEVSLKAPVNAEKLLRLTKDADIWSYSNVNAYLDGCGVFAQMLEQSSI